MAEKKENTKSKETAKSSSSGKTAITLNKVAFYTMAVVAVLYLVAMILSAVGLSSKIVGAMQGVATAIMICIVSVLGWRYVSKKPAVWVVLYVVCLLIVVIGIIVPLVL